MPSYQYRKSHCGDKTILWLSYLHNGTSYTGKMASLYWIRALVPNKQWYITWTNVDQDVLHMIIMQNFQNKSYHVALPLILNTAFIADTVHMVMKPWCSLLDLARFVKTGKVQCKPDISRSCISRSHVGPQFLPTNFANFADVAPKSAIFIAKSR